MPGRLPREEGASVILVVPHAHQIPRLTERALILDRGTVVHSSASTEDAALSRHSLAQAVAGTARIWRAW